MVWEWLLAVLPLYCIWCYRQGLRDGRTSGELPPLLPRPARRPPQSRRQDYLDDIERNLDCYNGSGEGQREVRR